MLQEFDDCPPGLLQAEVGGLAGLLGGPSLIHLPGRRPEPLFVSVLLHGNEDTGFYALRELLRRHQGQPLPRALSVFIGNVTAASLGRRHLDGQPDYNRVWPGGEAVSGPEAAMMAQVVRRMAGRGVFASIDVHNNTGRNPHYGCVNRVDYRHLHLATLFSRTVVYFTRPRGVQSMAMAELCPAVTVECGQPGQAHGVAHALEFIEAALNLQALPVRPIPTEDLDLFHTVATLRLRDGVRASFDSADQADLIWVPDLDHLNFLELEAGTALGELRDPERLPLAVIDAQGRDRAAAYFRLGGHGRLLTRRPFMPSMLTHDLDIQREDCVGYVMERYQLVPPPR